MEIVVEINCAPESNIYKIMKTFLSFSYWLNTQPGGISQKALVCFSVFVAALAVLAFIFYLMKTRKKSIYGRIWDKLYFFSVTNFIIGLLFIFFTYEHIPFLSTRILLAIWGAGIIVWLVFIVRNCMQIPKIKAEREKEDAFNKYIP